MKKIKIALKYLVIFTLLISSFVACDKDYATIGSDIVGQNNFGTASTKYEVIAYNKAFGALGAEQTPIQTNGLPLNLLGVYNDPLYGMTTANFVSQLNSTNIDPSFGTNVHLDSVVLSIPYFSRAIDVNDEGTTTYELDSVYGDDPIKLSIHENNYFLRNFDPNTEFSSPQRYYSNMSSGTSSPISSTQLTGTLLYEDESFIPTPNQIIIRNEDQEIIDRLPPALRITLDNAFWQEKIIDKEGEPELSNSNNFLNYFRGLYFKTEAVNGSGHMSILNFAASNANVTLYYTKDGFTEDADPINSTYVLTFTGNRVNFLSNNFNFPLQNGNSTTGDEKLYLKGGEGSMAVVNLFNGGDDGTSTEFTTFLNTYKDPTTGKMKRLVNEANLVFYVDQTLVQGQEPERVYLYDLKNNTPLVDYFLDNSNTVSPVDSKINHLGRLEREGDEITGQGIKYKIRITEHINNILIRDSTNVKLGLVVSGNVNLENSFIPNYVLTNDNTEVVKKVPVSSIITPKGTALYGNNTTNEEKKLYLEIFYTEPNN